MNSDELVRHFNTVFGIRHPWPQTYIVDAETYGYCCQAVFDNTVKRLSEFLEDNTFVNTYAISLGHNNGIMFKNVELILEKKL